MKTFFTVFVLFLFLSYLTAAFITLQLNPVNWNIQARAATSIIGMLIGGFIAMAVTDFSDKND
jgi:uncharacterized membrane protein